MTIFAEVAPLGYGDHHFEDVETMVFVPSPRSPAKDHKSFEKTAAKRGACVQLCSGQTHPVVMNAPAVQASQLKSPPFFRILKKSGGWHAACCLGRASREAGVGPHLLQSPNGRRFEGNLEAPSVFFAGDLKEQ
jgi:hypothetical protein